MPLVSVIIATYNRARWLPGTIESVLAQTFRDFELIVVDDGSTDNTTAVLQPFDGRLRYTHQVNAERGAARNTGMRIASGEFVAFLDSDDLWTPTKLEAEVASLRADPSLGLVYSDALLIDELGTVTGSLPRYRFRGDVLADVVRQNFVPLSAHLLRRDAFERAGGFSEDRTMSGSEDWEAWTRLAAICPFSFTGNVGLHYRVHAQGSVASPKAIERSMHRAIDVMFGNSEVASRVGRLRPETEAYAALVAASLYHAAGDSSAARESVRRAVRTNPGVVFSSRFAAVASRAALGLQATGALKRAAAHLGFK
jgi:glycosyltransferase involved in cell wall biosynthesis